MKIRTKLTLIFTIISATILLAVVLIINYAASKSREAEFYALLKKEAATKANLFFNANIESRILQDIYCPDFRLSRNHPRFRTILVQTSTVHYFGWKYRESMNIPHR